jgi:hypothetical protein
VTGRGRELGGSFALGPWRVRRAGYGAMQLSGDGVFGPPRDRYEALRVLRAAAAAGVDHIDTAQFYGAGTVNELIHEALYRCLLVSECECSSFRQPLLAEGRSPSCRRPGGCCAGLTFHSRLPLPPQRLGSYGRLGVLPPGHSRRAWIPHGTCARSGGWSRR